MPLLLCCPYGFDHQHLRIGALPTIRVTFPAIVCYSAIPPCCGGSSWLRPSILAMSSALVSYLLLFVDHLSPLCPHWLMSVPGHDPYQLVWERLQLTSSNIAYASLAYPPPHALVLPLVLLPSCLIRRANDKQVNRSTAIIYTTDNYRHYPVPHVTGQRLLLCQRSTADDVPDVAPAPFHIPLAILL